MPVLTTKQSQFYTKTYNLRMTSFFLLPLAWITLGRRRRTRIEYLRKIKSVSIETKGGREGERKGKKKKGISNTKFCLNMQKSPLIIFGDINN